MPHYLATKTYSPERGLSCTFRQWRATHSHCRFLHGYALGVRLTFACEQLDDKFWVYDFGAMTWIKEFLDHTFDHTTCIAADDPALMLFQQMAEQGVLQLRVLPVVGCEGFAHYIHGFVQPRIQADTQGRVTLISVEVFEHGANSATYKA